jgi:hypothetical protein
MTVRAQAALLATVLALATGKAWRGADAPPPGAVVSVMTATPAESLRLETDVPSQVRAGEPVPITLRATNTGSRPLEMYLMGRSVTFDITVSRPSGAVVWRRLDGQTVPAILQFRILAPGETLELRHDWDQRATRGRIVSPGTYVVQGALLTDAQPLRTPAVSLRIVARAP